MLDKLKNFSRSKELRTYQYRMEALLKLEELIIKNEDNIYKALYEDLSKSKFETQMSEISVVLNEIKYFKKNLKFLMKPKKVSTSLVHFRAKSYIYYENYGLALIVSPWNYPINLVFTPLVGAIAAGNTVLLKPPTKVVKTNKIIRQIIDQMPDKLVTYTENKDLIEREKFDIIFFTGSTETGKYFYKKAAEDMVPCILELGGKSPAIVDATADIKKTAMRILFGKLINAGQTCVAVDHVFADENIKNALLYALWETAEEFYKDPLNNPEYPRIINKVKYLDIIKKLKSEDIEYSADEESLKIAPVIFDASIDSQFMKEEIFAPVLPVIGYRNLGDVLNYLRGQNPLSIYTFSKDDDFNMRIVENLRYGGGCINDSLVHISNENLPFGGFHSSGIGKYHGRASFMAFSHEKSIMDRKFSPEIKFRYPPFEGKLGLLKKIF